MYPGGCVGQGVTPSEWTVGRTEKSDLTDWLTHRGLVKRQRYYFNIPSYRVLHRTMVGWGVRVRVCTPEGSRNRFDIQFLDVQGTSKRDSVSDYPFGFR